MFVAPRPPETQTRVSPFFRGPRLFALLRAFRVRLERNHPACAAQDALRSAALRKHPYEKGNSSQSPPCTKAAALIEGCAAFQVKRRVSAPRG